ELERPVVERVGLRGTGNLLRGRFGEGVQVGGIDVGARQRIGRVVHQRLRTRRTRAGGDVALARVGPLRPADQVLVGSLHRRQDLRLVAGGAEFGHEGRNPLRLRVCLGIADDAADARYASQRAEVELAVVVERQYGVGGVHMAKIGGYARVGQDVGFEEDRCARIDRPDRVRPLVVEGRQLLTVEERVAEQGRQERRYARRWFVYELESGHVGVTV